MESQDIDLVFNNQTKQNININTIPKFIGTKIEIEFTQDITKLFHQFCLTITHICSATTWFRLDHTCSQVEMDLVWIIRARLQRNRKWFGVTIGRRSKGKAKRRFGSIIGSAYGTFGLGQRQVQVRSEEMVMFRGEILGGGGG